MRIKQSACYPMLKPVDMPADIFISKVAQIGYCAIGLWGRDEHLPEMVTLARRHNLIVSIMSGHDSLTVGLNDPDQHNRIEQELRASIDLAAQYDIPGLICFSGNRSPGVTDEEAMTYTVQGLSRIAPYAEAKGINLNLELLNSKVDHPGYQSDSSAWGLAVVKKVNSPNVKLLFDIYHMQIMEGDIIRTIQDNMDWIGHFHTAGVPGRYDLDDMQELNYRGICRAIAETEYPYYVEHEFRPKGEVIAALQNAFDICDQEPDLSF
ncbi:MAG: TIM barrel protein [Anaerolineae bacterium]|nr:TIM barrel protein [Anaerolineae bacterium]